MSPRRPRSIACRGLAAALAVFAGLTLPAVAADPATIATWEFDAASAGKASTLEGSAHAPGVAVSALAAVGTSGALDYPRTLMYSSWPPAGSGIDRGQYYEFTVTPLDGRAVTYRSITLSVASGGKGTARVEIHASTDGFGESDVTAASFTYPANTTIQIARELDLSALGTEARPVTFRVFMEKGDSGFGGLAHTDAFGGGTPVIVAGEVADEAP